MKEIKLLKLIFVRVYLGVYIHKKMRVKTGKFNFLNSGKFLNLCYMLVPVQV